MIRKYLDDLLLFEIFTITNKYRYLLVLEFFKQYFNIFKLII